MDQKVRHPRGRAAALAASGKSDAEVADELHLVTLSRFPTAAERAVVVRRLRTAADRRTAVEDVLHALVNHPEFLFQH